MERLGHEKLPNRSDAQKVKWKRRQRIPRKRWEDCVKRGLERVGRKCRTTAKDRRSWRLLIENVVRIKQEEKIRRKIRRYPCPASPLTTGLSRGEQRECTPPRLPRHLLPSATCYLPSLIGEWMTNATWPRCPAKHNTTRVERLQGSVGSQRVEVPLVGSSHSCGSGRPAQRHWFTPVTFTYTSYLICKAK